VKTPVDCPEAIAVVDGTVRLALLLERAIANPPEGALPDNVTVHAVLPGVLIVEFVQLRLLRVVTGTGRETAPEPPLAGMEVATAVAATTPVSVTGIGLLEGLPAIWNVATATVPSAIALPLNPAMRQLFPEQEIDFPAFMADVPAITVTPVISEEKLNDH